MKQTFVLLLAIVLFGCSYSLKTSVIQDVSEPSDYENLSMESCMGNNYCRLKVLAQIDDVKDYEAYIQSYPAANKQWEAFLQSKINYAALTEESCEAVIDPYLKNRCELAVRFNAGMNDCSLESDPSICWDQHIFSRPNEHDCHLDGLTDNTFCSTALALMSHQRSHCEHLSGNQKTFCQSLVSNSLYFCKSEDCSNYYFERNMTESPRLTYCRFDDASLQEKCQENIRTWFAMAQNNVLYCSTKECYEWLIQKQLVSVKQSSLESVQSWSCNHLDSPNSLQRCQSFVSDVYATSTGTIRACESFLCFESFKGNMDIVNESDCNAFESQVLENDQDVFGEREELSMCLAVVDYNRAVQAHNKEWCLDSDCIEEVESLEQEGRRKTDEVQDIDLYQEIDSEMSSEELKQTLEQVDVEEVLEQVDLNEVVDGIDVNQLKNILNTDGSLDDVDLNERLKEVDLNEEIKNMDIDLLLDQINIEELVPAGE